MLDDGASASITNDHNDFIQKPRGKKHNVQGIAGSAQATLCGTIQWYLDDDQGCSHKFTILNTYYITIAPTRILSPQHFAQQIEDHKPMAEGIGCVTNSKSVTLFWDQQKYTKTIYFDLKLNIAMTRTSSGSKVFRAYMANHQEPCNNVHVFKTHISLDENSFWRRMITYHSNQLVKLSILKNQCRQNRVIIHKKQKGLAINSY